MKRYKNKIIIGLGSNSNYKENMVRTRRRLKDYFPEIDFSNDELTDPVDWITDDPFLNAVAIAYTDLEKEEVRSYFKTLEAECGRTKALKLKGVIPMDIDMLKWNDEVLKVKDLQLDYVINGLQSLENKLSE